MENKHAGEIKLEIKQEIRQDPCYSKIHASLKFLKVLGFRNMMMPYQPDRHILAHRLSAPQGSHLLLRCGIMQVPAETLANHSEKPIFKLTSEAMFFITLKKKKKKIQRFAIYRVSFENKIRF